MTDIQTDQRFASDSGRHSYGSNSGTAADWQSLPDRLNGIGQQYVETSSNKVTANGVAGCGQAVNGIRINGQANGNSPSSQRVHRVGIGHHNEDHPQGTYTENGCTNRSSVKDVYLNGDHTNDKKSCCNNIIDIRRDKSQACLAEMVKAGLSNPKLGLPSLVLWDPRGLELFDQITKLSNYYLTGAEMMIPKEQSGEMAQNIETGSMLVDLGCGNSNKLKPLLQALDNMGRSIDHYALDLSCSEVQRNLDAISRCAFRYIRCHGLFGTYEDASSWLQCPKNAGRPKCLFSLGSSIGNLEDGDAVTFLSELVEVLRNGSHPQKHPSRTLSSIVIGVDSCVSRDRVSRAYDDASGLNAKFLLNALVHANSLLGREVFRTENWTVRREWSDGCHIQYLVPLTDVHFGGVHLKAGAKVHVVQSKKYDAEGRKRLWRRPGLENCTDGGRRAETMQKIRWLSRCWFWTSEKDTKGMDSAITVSVWST